MEKMSTDQVSQQDNNFKDIKSEKCDMMLFLLIFGKGSQVFYQDQILHILNAQHNVNNWLGFPKKKLRFSPIQHNNDS